MRRIITSLAAGALLLGSTLAAQAQAPAGPTVSFGGQMRVFGFWQDNITDFKDSDKGNFRDSNSFYFQRWRLFTTVESADKKAKAVWALEVGDITWGSGGGASGGEYGGTGTRVGPGGGGEFGSDGVNVETKHLYVAFQVPGVQGMSLQLGQQNIVFMGGPLGGFLDDDGPTVKLDWKIDPVDIQVYTMKPFEGARANSDDVDMYVARVGVNMTKDIRFSVEGMVVDQRNQAKTDFGDTFWVGGTAGLNLQVVQLDAAVVYGQRTVKATAGSGKSTFEESGFGAFLLARVPVGPVSINALGWYTSGDDKRGPGSPTNGGAAGIAADSDKLPLPAAGASWFGGGPMFIAEGLFGNSTIGAPSVGQQLYADPTGTYGIGGSAVFALTPEVSLGGGVAYVGATDAQSPTFGDYVFTIDGGIIYKLNANLQIAGVGSYLIPDKNDAAWQLAFRTQFSF